MVTESRDIVAHGAAAPVLAALAESALLARATLLAREGDLTQAQALLVPLVGAETRSPAVLDLLAKVYAQQGRLEEARELWRQALETDPLNEFFQRAAQRCRARPRAGSAFLVRLLAAVLFAVGLAGVTTMVRGQRRLASEVQAMRTQVVHLVQMAAAPATPAPAPAEDSRLAARVKQALEADPGIAALRLRVSQEGGVTRLAGEVLDLATRYRVERLARAVRGVKVVDAGALTLAETYQVRPGDSLWLIAGRVYGAPEKKQLLAQANHLTYPYALHVGQRLVIPRPGVSEKH